MFGLWVWGFVNPMDGAGKGNLAVGSYLVPGHYQYSHSAVDLCSLCSSSSLPVT